jgi:hypothetical protein
VLALLWLIFSESKVVLQQSAVTQH